MFKQSGKSAFLFLFDILILRVFIHLHVGVGEKCGIRRNGWCLSQKVTELYEIRKKLMKKFGGFRKMLYLCIAFDKRGSAKNFSRLLEGWVSG